MQYVGTHWISARAEERRRRGKGRIEGGGMIGRGEGAEVEAKNGWRTQAVQFVCDDGAHINFCTSAIILRALTLMYSDLKVLTDENMSSFFHLSFPTLLNIFAQ